MSSLRRRRLPCSKLDSGCASRSEYWWWFLWSFDVNSPIGSAIIGLWYLAILIPSIAIQVRRLHDANVRGWWILLNLIFILGQIAVFVMTLMPPRPEGQRFDRQTA